MSSSDSIHVLHVDDDPDFVALTAKLLEREDDRFEVDTATGANEGLDYLAENDIDCIVSDYDIPDVDGIAFLEAVREAYADLPFILFTGKGSEEVASEAIARGATDYLQKQGGTGQYTVLSNRIDNAVDQYRAQHHAQIQHQQYRDLFERAPVMYVAVRDEDDESIIDYCNQRFASRLGYDRDDILGRSTWDFYTDESLEEAREGLERAKNSEYQREERRLVTRSGDVIETIVQATPRHDEAGNVIGALALFVDITEQRERERELELFETMIETVPDGVYAADEDLCFIAVNDEMAELTGYCKDELVGSHGSLVHDEAGVEAANEARKALRESNDPTEIQVVEHTYYTRDGDLIPCEVRFRALPSDDGFRGTAGVVRDVTDRNAREHALEQLHEATRDLMTATTAEDVATIGSETATEVLDLPRNAIQLYDTDEDALVPVAWADASESTFNGPPPSIPAGQGLAWKTYETGEPNIYADVREEDDVLNPETSFRSELQFPLGEHGILLATSTEVDDFDTTDAALARALAANVEAALDRVEREQELKRQNDRLDEFASIVSHDLRTPLNVATGRLALAQEECESDHLAAVARANDRMEALVEGLLTLAREGDVALESTPVGLADAVEECWQAIETAEATLVIDADCTIQADYSRLRRLLENLVRNAVEHGGEDVTITVGVCDDGFYVADDGPGIASEDRERVFETGYSTADEGSGLGLSIVKQIANAHGWDTEITDSSDGGVRIELLNVDIQRRSSLLE